MSKAVIPVSWAPNGLAYPVKLGTAPGLSDGLYLVWFENFARQVVSAYHAVVAETDVGWAMGSYPDRGYIEDCDAAIDVPGRRGIGRGPHFNDKMFVKVQRIPDSAHRAVQMGRARGFAFAEPAEVS